MLYKITLSGKNYWYDPQWLQLYEDEAGTIVQQTKWLSEEDQKNYLKESGKIREAYLLSRQQNTI